MLKESLITVVTSLSSLVTLFFLTKLIGEKQVSELDIFDYIVGISFGSIAAEMATDIENWHKPFVAMVIYGVFSFAVSIISNKSIKFRRFVLGNPTVIYLNGKLFNENLKKAKIDINEFLYLCRTNGYFDLSSLYSIILEPNGKLSFLPVSNKRPMSPSDISVTPEQEVPLGNVIIDSKIMKSNLKNLGFNETWLNEQLKNQGATLKEVFLATCDGNGCLTVYKRQPKSNVMQIFN